MTEGGGVPRRYPSHGGKPDMAVDSEFEKLSQLDAIIDDPQRVIVHDLAGQERVFRGETFSTYKTKHVLKMLAGVKDQVNIAQLISEILVMVSDPEQIEPGNQSDAAKEQRTNLQVSRVTSALSAIPKLMEFAPDLALDFAALAVIPNREVLQAYEAGNIDEVRAKNRKMFEFEFSADAPLHILVKFIPFVGIDFLAREIGMLNQTVTSLAPENLKGQPSTG